MQDKKSSKPAFQICNRLPDLGQVDTPTIPQRWTIGVCPNCGFIKADVDPTGVLWCPACGYSKKGAFT